MNKSGKDVFPLLKNKYLFFAFLLYTFPLKGYSVSQLENTRKIKLEYPFVEEVFECSGLALWGKDKVLFLPQNMQCLFYAESETLRFSIKNDVELRLKVLPALGFEELKRVLTDSIHAVFDGCEAIVVVGNTIFITVETNTNDRDCFVIKGIITTSGVQFDRHWWVALPKPWLAKGPIHNAGFESLTWVPDQQKLLAVSEFNHLKDIKPEAYWIDTGLRNISPVAIESLHFRITDAYYDPRTKELYALNFWYRGDTNLYDIPREIKEEGYVFKPHKRNYCRVMKASYLENGQFSGWQKECLIPSGKNCNWEGICSFDSGFLIVTDDNKGIGDCIQELRYVSGE